MTEDVAAMYSAVLGNFPYMHSQIQSQLPTASTSFFSGMDNNSRKGSTQTANDSVLSQQLAEVSGCTNTIFHTVSEIAGNPRNTPQFNQQFDACNDSAVDSTTAEQYEASSSSSVGNVSSVESEHDKPEMTVLVMEIT
jgi:hypothetical protein